MYRSLDPEAIVATIERLHRRIVERFPDSGLAAVAGELLQVGREARSRIEEIGRPHVPLRVAVGVLILAIVGVIVLAVSELDLGAESLGLRDFIPIAEAATNELVLVGALIFFLVTLERRWRRTQVLRSIHELRSLAHVVDMHQLTKDPHRIAEPGGVSTPSSPDRRLTPFLLARYLDYCSELASLIGKVAALYLARSDEPAVIASVSDVDQLTTGLSRKVWQKIIILHAAGGGSTPIARGERGAPPARD